MAEQGPMWIGRSDYAARRARLARDKGGVWGEMPIAACPVEKRVRMSLDGRPEKWPTGRFDRDRRVGKQ
jgi:hypothetical protein